MASRGVNKVILVGNVGNDPECREGNSGAVANLSVATSDTWKDKNPGERQPVRVNGQPPPKGGGPSPRPSPRGVGTGCGYRAWASQSTERRAGNRRIRS